MSLSRAEQSRINGAKSRGPKTEQGKQRSSQNACKHGLTAQKFVLLESEHDDDGFDRLLQAFIARFEPADEVEYDLVFEAAASRWKLRRCWAIEVSTFDHKIEDRREWVEDRYSECTEHDHLTMAFGWLSSDNVILTLNRYQSRIRRDFERALRDLAYIRSGRIPPVGQVRDLRRAPRPASSEPELPNEPDQPVPFPSRDCQGAVSSINSQTESELPNEPETTQMSKSSSAARHPDMKYALLVHQTQEHFDNRNDAAAIAAGRAYGEALQAAGVFVGGAGLESPKAATTVSIRQGKRQVHDGPYAETKEFLAGFGIIDVPNLDAALEWAARHPAAAFASIEVRPLLGSHFVSSSKAS